MKPKPKFKINLTVVIRIGAYSCLVFLFVVYITCCNSIMWKDKPGKNPNGSIDNWGYVGVGGIGVMFNPTASSYIPGTTFVSYDITGSFVAYNDGESGHMFNIHNLSPHFETVWLGLFDIASLCWNYEYIQVEQAHVKFRHRFYSPEMKNSIFEFQYLLEKATPFWATALLNEGVRETHHKTFKLIDLPDPKKEVEGCLKYRSKII